MSQKLYLYVPEQYILLADDDDERLDAYLPENYDGDDWDEDVRLEFDWAISDAEVEDQIILTKVDHG